MRVQDNKLLWLVLCSGALVVLAGPYWSGQIDDLYITLAYAHTWVDTGRLAWSTGEAVEGYSNFGLLLPLTAAAAVGLDTALVAHVLSMVGGFAVLAVAAVFGPDDRRTLLLMLALALCSPLAVWSARGMETTVYAAVLCGAWGLAVTSPRAWSAAVWLGCAAALLRPEGIAHLGLILLVRARFSDGMRRSDAVAAGALALLVLYHAVRVWWFEALLPTPLVVKANPARLRFGAWQLVVDALVLAGAWVTAVVLFRPPRDLAWLALVPALVQALALLAIDGDWMGSSRILLPGVAASCVLWSATGSGHRPRPHAYAVALVAIALAWPWQAGMTDLSRRPTTVGWSSTYGAGLDTPLFTDLEYVVEHLPDGTTLLGTDVGILGHVSGIRVRDGTGLVDRAWADFRTGHREDPFSPELIGPGQGQVQAIRHVDWQGGEPPPPQPEVLARLTPTPHELKSNAGTVHWWRVDQRDPHPDVVRRRWRELAERFPSHPKLVRKHLELAAGVSPDASGKSNPTHSP